MTKNPQTVKTVWGFLLARQYEYSVTNELIINKWVINEWVIKPVFYATSLHKIAP